MNRLDYRTLDTFKKDILFSTKLEEFWFKLYLCQITSIYDKIEYENTGTDNKGKYQRVANKNADYTIYLTKLGKTVTRKIDIKWAPTPGKATFKVDNLKHYIKDDTNILLFYNTGDKRLIKRKDYDLTKHIEEINKVIKNIKYGIIAPYKMEKILKNYEHKKNYYMGNKVCVEIPSSDFSKYFDECDIK